MILMPAVGLATGHCRKLINLFPCGDKRVELAFESPALRAICEDQQEARRVLGDQVSEALRHRLADLRAADAIADLPAGRPRNLNGSSDLMMDLCDEYGMVLRANHVKNPAGTDGKPDWSQVSRIRVLKIVRFNA